MDGSLLARGFERLCRAGRCCHVFGLFERCLLMPLAIMLSADRVPVKTAQSKLHWLVWGVLISGPTGWVHYPFVVPLQPRVRQSKPARSQAACAAGSW